MTLLGEAFVRVRPDTTGFEREAQSGLGGGIRKIAAGITTAFASVKVGGFLKDAVTEASDYGETVSKAANVFGTKLAPAIQQFATTAPKAFGISETAALAATAQFGNMFIQLGFTGDAAAKASTNLIKTAADLGSFNNVDPSDVLERIGASLRGEFDSLQQLIPNINATRVANEALAATGKKTAGELTAQEKATATLAIIQKDGALAANDFAETSGGLANQQRILSATVDTLQRRLGDALLPTVTSVVTYLAANAEPAFNRVAAATESFIGAFRDPDSVTRLGTSVDGVATAGARAREVFDAAREVVGGFIDRVQAGDFSSVGQDLSSSADSAQRLLPVVQDLAASVPSLSDALGVASTVLRVGAENTDVLAQIVPVLAAGFIALKVAQLASNVAAVASIPLRVAEVVAQRALTQSIAAQTAALATNTVASGVSRAATVGSTVATTASTAATNVGILARARETAVTAAGTVATTARTAATAVATGATAAWTAVTGTATAAATALTTRLIPQTAAYVAGTASRVANTAATVASSVASGVATLATTALTGATTALGVAVRFALGPLGLAITAAGLLAAGLTLAFQRSDTFRGIVDRLWASIKTAASHLRSFLGSLNEFKIPGWVRELGGLVGGIGGGFRSAFGAVARGVGDGPGRVSGGSTLRRVQGLVTSMGGSISSTYRSPARNRAVGGSPTSFHLDRENPAVDIVARSTAALDAIHARLQSMGGWRELLWRVPNHAPGDNPHIHVADRGGVFQGPGMVWMGAGQETFASGLAAKKVADLPPSDTGRLVELLEQLVDLNAEQARRIRDLVEQMEERDRSTKVGG